jgi:hypothetical protein
MVPKDREDSLGGLGGYHGSVHQHDGAGADVTIYYAVGVYSQPLSDGTVNGIVAFDEPWKNVVATFYHELQEARTDPDVEDAINAGDDPRAESFLGWTSDQGEECGDFPVFEADPLSLVFQEVPLADGSGTVPIQLQYSNRVHGPELPDSARTDEGAAPAGDAAALTPTTALIELLSNPATVVTNRSFETISAASAKVLRGALKADNVHLNDVDRIRSALLNSAGAKHEIVLALVRSSGPEKFNAAYVVEGSQLLGRVVDLA